MSVPVPVSISACVCACARARVLVRVCICVPIVRQRVTLDTCMHVLCEIHRYQTGACTCHEHVLCGTCVHVLYVHVLCVRCRSHGDCLAAVRLRACLILPLPVSLSFAPSAPVRRKNS